MKKTAKLLILVLCLCTVLAACKKPDEYETDPSMGSSVLSESEAQDSESDSSEAESSDVSSSDSSVNEKGEIILDFKSLPSVSESDKYGDLLAQIPAGKKLTMLGDLTDEKYSDAAARLEKLLNGYDRTFSLVAFSLDNLKAVSYNAEAELFPACTVKAFYSLFSCLEMDKGNGSLDTVMTYENKHYEPGTGDMQYQPIGTKFDMKTIISKSMSISDNVGYFMQVDYFGRDAYNNWVTAEGGPSLTVKPTTWALKAKADEHAVLWREIYRYFMSDAKHAEFLYSTCTGTDYNFSTSKLDGVAYSHKSGFNRDTKWNSMSDAGIVWKGQSPYVVVMLSNAPGINSTAQSLMDEVITVLHNELF